MNEEKLAIVNKAMEISSKLLNAASKLSTAEDVDTAAQVWEEQNIILDELLADLADFNEGFKKQLELACGRELTFTA